VSAAPDTAVILAAGLGSRLGARGAEAPKGFLELGERPIVEESIEHLTAVGVGRVVIVTGHHAGHEELAARRGGLVTTVHNERYAETGSMSSLWRAREQVEGDFLLLESDLIYEHRALESLLADPAENALLLSGPTGAGDEVFVGARDRQVVAMSKDPGTLEDPVVGELVGITRVSAALFGGMLEAFEDLGGDDRRIDYETDALVAAARTHALHWVLVEDLLWAEIDDASHLERAQALYPRLRGRA